MKGGEDEWVEWEWECEDEDEDEDEGAVILGG